MLTQPQSGRARDDSSAKISTVVPPTKHIGRDPSVALLDVTLRALELSKEFMKCCYRVLLHVRVSIVLCGEWVNGKKQNLK